MENISPKTCKISSGTTLEELARYFDLAPEQLKWYHNQYCPSEDRIKTDIPKHTQIIFVPPIEKELREIIFWPFSEYHSKNFLSSPASYTKDYGVVQTILVNNEEQVRVHYEIKITKQGSRVIMARQSVYINDQKPGIIVEQLADEIGNILFPLEIMFDGHGELDSILNQQQILDKWLNQEQQGNLQKLLRSWGFYFQLHFLCAE